MEHRKSTVSKRALAHVKAENPIFGFRLLWVQALESAPAGGTYSYSFLVRPKEVSIVVYTTGMYSYVYVHEFCTAVEKYVPAATVVCPPQCGLYAEPHASNDCVEFGLESYIITSCNCFVDPVYCPGTPKPSYLVQHIYS